MKNFGLHILACFFAGVYLGKSKFTTRLLFTKASAWSSNNGTRITYALNKTNVLFSVSYETQNI